MKKLYAGPWVGEFGWEIASWSPSIRHIAKDYDHVIVETQPDSEYLYEFADEIIINPHLPDFDMYSGKVSKPAFQPPAGTRSITPMWFWKAHAKKEFKAIKVADKVDGIHPKEWRKLGSERPKHVADIMCAFRGPKKYRKRSYPEKEYPRDKCEGLVKRLLDAGYSVACYGGTDNVYIEGTVDFRGVGLGDLCGALSAAKVAIGPSSGTLHLASACGTPHVSWYGRPVVSMERYLSYWNPFNTPVTFIDVPTPNVDLSFNSCVARMNPETPIKHWTKT
ncbi:hypothetical protein LCGC14_0245070 [marine sediment metagenome]|uniref:Glycosyltransferase family 9 (Heptosyltransferase) n=1 Tax=marine sediment metagenome TaxID=412755 RepID=A0A0F9U6R7_9ZZZZ